MESVKAYPIMNNFLISMMSTFVTKIYNNVSSEEVQEVSDMGSELCIPSTATGYIRFLNVEEDIIPRLHDFRVINTNGRWLIFSSYENEGYIEDMLRMSFDNQNMINILVHNYRYSTDVDALHFYDPFFVDSALVRGKLFTLELYQNVTLQKIYEFLDQFGARTSDLRGYEMLVDLYPRAMYAEAIYDKYGHVERYHFIEGLIIDLLSRMMNFKIIYSLLNKTKMPGIVLPNGTVIDGLALIEFEKVNYSAVSRLIVPSGLNNTAYLYPIEIFDAHFVVPKLYPISSISLSGFGLFDMTTIIMIWVSVVCCIIVRYIINVVEATQDNRPEVLRLASQVIGFQNGISQPISNISSTSDRIIIISCLILYLTVGTSYQGLILAQLQEKETNQINTLQEVLDSDLQLFNTIDVPDIFKPDETRKELSVRNKIYYKFKETIKQFHKIMENKCEKWQAGEKMAILTREKSAKYYVGTCYNENDGKDLLYMVPQIAATYQTAQIVPKSSPFTHVFNNKILRIFEVGLNEYSEMEIHHRNYIQRIKRYQNTTRNHMEELKLVRFENLYQAFVTLVITYSIAFIIFLFEILMHSVQGFNGGNFFRNLHAILYETRHD